MGGFAEGEQRGAGGSYRRIGGSESRTCDSAARGWSCGKRVRSGHVSGSAVPRGGGEREGTKGGVTKAEERRERTRDGGRERKEGVRRGGSAKGNKTWRETGRDPPPLVRTAPRHHQRALPAALRTKWRPARDGPSAARCTEPRNQGVWKRTLRSSSPTRDRAPACQPENVTECHLHMVTPPPH